MVRYLFCYHEGHLQVVFSQVDLCVYCLIDLLTQVSLYLLLMDEYLHFEYCLIEVL
jgi:hypothetical protein